MNCSFKNAHLDARRVCRRPRRDPRHKIAGARRLPARHSEAVALAVVGPSHHGNPQLGACRGALPPALGAVPLPLGSGGGAVAPPQGASFRAVVGAHHRLMWVESVVSYFTI